MKKVVLYTRLHCHLCDIMKEQVEDVRAHNPFHFFVYDIDKDPELKRLYHEEVPVLVVEGEKIAKHRLDADMLLRRLKEPTA